MHYIQNTELVLASNNLGKLKEFQKLLTPFGLTVIPQKDLDIPDAEEPYLTFIENALAKARHASKLSGKPALADDSGICVDALDGEPGVRSARFSGEEKNDGANNVLLLKKMENESNRAARYVCVLVMVRHADDPQPLIVEGEWHGSIFGQQRGIGGFGYDSLFYLSDLDLTAAELSEDMKNVLSHRAVACRKLIEKIEKSFT